MINLDAERLLKALTKADEFNLPEMTEGEKYIYDNIYMRLSQEEETRLSDIDFSKFELDDIDCIRNLYFNTLEVNETKSNSIATTLRCIPPITTATAFV